MTDRVRPTNDGSVLRLLRLQRRFDWMQRATEAFDRMAGKLGLIDMIMAVRQRVARDRVIDRLERGATQDPFDLGLVFGEQLTHLSGFEKQELLGGPVPDDAERIFLGESPPRHWQPRHPQAMYDPNARGTRIAAPARKVAAEEEADAEDPTAHLDGLRREFARWKASPVRDVLTALDTPMLREPNARQSVAWEAVAVAWARDAIREKSLQEHLLPAAVRAWLRQDNLRSTAQANDAVRARGEIVDGLRGIVDRHASAVRRPLHYTGTRAGLSSAVASPAPQRASPDELHAPPVLRPITDGGVRDDPSLPPEPPALRRPIRNAPPAPPPVTATPIVAPTDAPALPPPPVHAMLYLADGSTRDAILVRLEGANAIVQDERGREGRIGPLERRDGPAVEAEDPMHDCYVIGGHARALVLPPSLMGDRAFRARLLPAWTAADFPPDAQEVAAALVTNGFDAAERDAMLTTLSRSDAPADQIWASAVDLGFGRTDIQAGGLSA